MVKLMTNVMEMNIVKRQRGRQRHYCNTPNPDSNMDLYTDSDLLLISNLVITSHYSPSHGPDT